jgi:uncharacterized protein YodC (DUF2158 family)
MIHPRTCRELDVCPERNARIDIPYLAEFDLIVGAHNRGRDSPDEFAAGDRVRDRHFGQPMAVADVYPPSFDYRYRCVWTDTDGNPGHELFRAADLLPDIGPMPDE